MVYCSRVSSLPGAVHTFVSVTSTVDVLYSVNMVPIIHQRLSLRCTLHHLPGAVMTDVAVAVFVLYTVEYSTSVAYATETFVGP